MQLKLTDKHVKLITETAINVYLEETKKKELEKHDRRLRNVKLLLRNYRSFVKHCEDIKLDIRTLQDQLDLEDLETDEFAVKSIMRSKERTLAMVRFITKMLNVYGKLCEDEGPEAKRRFNILTELYVDEHKKTLREIADVHFLTVKTVQRDVNKAVETLAILMFGVDGVKFR